MKASPISGGRLVADVGGTHTRLALAVPGENTLRVLRSYANRDFPCFEAILETWFENLRGERPGIACIAVAAPPADDWVCMTNVDWSFSCRDLARRFGLQRVVWINDFVANALALPYLGARDCEVLQAGHPAGGGRLAVLGPGTGLGGATIGGATIGGATTGGASSGGASEGGAALERETEACDVCACEPGYTGLSPADDEELALFALLLPHYGEVFAELLVSGPGLQRLYEALAQLRQQNPVARSPEQVTELALADEDTLCRTALLRFCALLGSVCGDFVLANGSYAGLYLAGGIVPKILPVLRESDFLHRFRAKGAMRRHLMQVPVYAITAGYPGLLGAARAPLPWRRNERRY